LDGRIVLGVWGHGLNCGSGGRPDHEEHQGVASWNGDRHGLEDARVNIVHYMRREKSGLAFTTLEIVKAEEQQGHQVLVREPTDKEGRPGEILYGSNGWTPDVEVVHSQMPLTSYHTNTPRFMFMHGEPLSSVGNGISMKAILDLAPKMDAFIAMREEEASVWSAIKRTYVVPKGIDLERFHPITVQPFDPEDKTTKLAGEPAVVYVEHWRGQRNPLYLLIAMQDVWKRLPKARLHLFNVTDQKMLDTFRAFVQYTKMWSFTRTIHGPVKDDDVNLLYNRGDIFVSCLYPLYARTIEAFGAGKAFIGPGYTDPEYPYHCTLDPQSMADAICKVWEERGTFDFRAWAEKKHDVQETVRQSVKIYERYIV
jgi:glycosyltransferase involved in cell wall biosynthesis